MAYVTAKLLLPLRGHLQPVGVSDFVIMNTAESGRIQPDLLVFK